MKIECLVVGAFEVNCYLAIHAAGRAAVIDPGADAARVADRVRRAGLTVTHYLITHGHVDHVSALAELDGLFPAPVVMHPADARWAFTGANHLEPYYTAPASPKSAVAFPDDFSLDVGGGRCRIIHTPGHSPGGVCYYFEDTQCLFAGDTLFQGTIGRTDLPGGDMAALTASLRQLRALPPATRVYSGHGAPTTLADECRTNPFMMEQP